MGVCGSSVGAVCGNTEGIVQDEDNVIEVGTTSGGREGHLSSSERRRMRTNSSLLLLWLVDFGNPRRVHARALDTLGDLRHRCAVEIELPSDYWDMVNLAFVEGRQPGEHETLQQAGITQDAEVTLKGVHDIASAIDVVKHAREGNIEEIKIACIYAPEKVHEVDLWDRWTALHWAAYIGHGKVVHTLLEASADVNAADKHGHQPLFYAEKVNKRGVMNQLVAAGAHPTEQTET
eukprot:TRINITY_DN16523_c0_g1_i1.p1 TRINITY_DN16523_c0_g1~~TRINITY_DN16523_c0_g1_i1.p1  ORF type:complete len:234 (-),score=36.78 TRINITY_DN16523_c0_g1_i1:170-871(-)